MNDVTDQVEVVEQTEAEELAQVMAGYNKTARVDEESAPAEVEKPTPEPEQVAEPVIETPPEPSVADELKALKAKVTALASTSDPDAVRRMHGEIGSINRTLQQLQAPKQDAAPVEDDLTAAIREAESSEFPEITAPLVKALKALSTARQAQTEQKPIDIAANVSTEVERIVKQNAIEALADEHPDYETVRDTPEFKKWLANKTPEFQAKIESTWNPAVVSRAISEFKDSLKVRQKKQERLELAVTPQGTPQKPGASTISDEEALMIGYNKAKRLTK
jgi:hypothetical protein